MMGLSYAFIFGDLNEGIIKFGISKNVKTRLSSLNRQYKYKYRLKIICVFENGASRIKKRLIKVFKKYQKQGDWFYYRGRLKEFIDEINYLYETKNKKGFDRLIEETLLVDYKKELLKIINDMSMETGGVAPKYRVIYEMLVKYENPFMKKHDPDKTIQLMINDLIDEKILYEPKKGFLSFVKQIPDKKISSSDFCELKKFSSHNIKELMK